VYFNNFNISHYGMLFLLTFPTDASEIRLCFRIRCLFYDSEFVNLHSCTDIRDSSFFESVLDSAEIVYL